MFSLKKMSALSILCIFFLSVTLPAQIKVTDKLDLNTTVTDGTDANFDGSGLDKPSDLNADINPTRRCNLVAPFRIQLEKVVRFVGTTEAIRQYIQAETEQLLHRAMIQAQEKCGEKLCTPNDRCLPDILLRSHNLRVINLVPVGHGTFKIVAKISVQVASKCKCD